MVAAEPTYWLAAANGTTMVESLQPARLRLEQNVGVARGCSKCTCAPQGGEKIGVIYREKL